MFCHATRSYEHSHIDGKNMPVSDFIEDIITGQSFVPATWKKQYVIVVLAWLKDAAWDSTYGKTFSNLSDLIQHLEQRFCPKRSDTRQLTRCPIGTRWVRITCSTENDALHYVTRHDTPLEESSTILEAATGSGSVIGKDLDERLEMSRFRRNAGLVARARRGRKSMKTLGLKNNSSFNLLTQVVDSISLYKVSIEDRSTPLTIFYVGLIFSLSPIKLSKIYMLN